MFVGQRVDPKSLRIHRCLLGDSTSPFRLTPDRGDRPVRGGRTSLLQRRSQALAAALVLQVGLCLIT